MVPIPDGWSTMTSIDKELHHNLRRVFRSGVTAESLARYEPAVLRNLEVYFSELAKAKEIDGWSVPADMRRKSKLISLSSLSASVLSSTFPDPRLPYFRLVPWL